MGLTNNLGKLSNMITSTGSAVSISGTLTLATTQYIGNLQFGTSSAATLGYDAGAGLMSFNIGAGAASSSPYYQFSSDGSPKVTILKGGNVGIGASSPKGRFDVFRAAGDSGTAAIVISSGESPSRNWSLNTDVVTDGDFAICVSTATGGTPSPSAVNTKFYLTKGGNVGIGTTTPTGLLDVASRGITKGSMPAGTVLQVLQTFKSDLFSTTSGSAVDITGFSVTITPTSSTSKILIFTTLFSVSDQNPYPKLILYRGATAIAQGTAGANTSKLSMMASYIAASDGTPISYSSSQIFLDSPATTSATTYKWQVSTFASRIWYMNRTVGDVDTNNQSAPSTITVMEIAQ